MFLNNLRFGFVSLLSTVGLAAWQYWRFRHRIGALRILLDFDDDNDAEGSPFADDSVELLKTVMHCRKRTRRRMAYILANKAYLQFGTRVNDEANCMITRKFLRDWCKSHLAKLRDYDASVAIDTAVPLSFIPPKGILEIRRYQDTVEWKGRVNGRFTWFWWVGSGLSPRSLERFMSYWPRGSSHSLGVGLVHRGA